MLMFYGGQASGYDWPAMYNNVFPLFPPCFQVGLRTSHQENIKSSVLRPEGNTHFTLWIAKKKIRASLSVLHRRSIVVKTRNVFTHINIWIPFNTKKWTNINVLFQKVPP